MLARLTRQPFDSADHVFELKWDGLRALAFVEGGHLRLQGRNLGDITAQFPELTQIPRALSTDQTVLDGELVCFDEEGRPSLERMQRRVQRNARGSVGRAPKAHFVAFDLLMLKGESVMNEPLSRRKSLLQDVLKPSELVQPCEFIESDGKDFYQATCDLGLEGIMAKDKSSPYLPGKRSSSWLKVKRVRECEFVIGGYAFGGDGEVPFGSLLLGLYDERHGLIFVGSVTNGLSHSQSKGLRSRLEELYTGECPFSETPVLQKFVYWCRPELACRVRYGEFTMDGRLRYPVYLTLRDDKPTADCRTVDAPGWPSATHR